MKDIKEMINEISRLDGYPKTDNIEQYILTFSNKISNIDISIQYSIIHHLYMIIKGALEDTACEDTREALDKDVFIKEFKELSVEELIERSSDEMWEPTELVELNILKDEITDIAELFATGKSNKKKEEYEEIVNIQNIINNLKERMLNNNKFVYRRLEEIVIIWDSIVAQIMQDIEYINTGDITKASEDLVDIMGWGRKPPR